MSNENTIKNTENNNDIKVRFCPSPTGSPHVGLVRTALFNWAYAKKTGGKLLFRIEDTDAERDSEESFSQIIECLNWMGIDWDEGVNADGKGSTGNDGPYRQSQRKHIYSEVINKLVDGGYAYKSFSTAEEIKQRNIANGKYEMAGYDGYDRSLTSTQIEDFLKEGRDYTIRFRMPDTDITFNDLIRGEITFSAEST
ncbi:MAG: glutamate--tRNA ligase, partial [Bifidobacteriaceae bacterium]|nr:glutamate--tRNA ligase [Bifidobacteriaceae bacterium]